MESTLEQRIDRLERENHRLKGWGLAGLAALAFLALGSPNPRPEIPDVVRE